MEIYYKIAKFIIIVFSLACLYQSTIFFILSFMMKRAIKAIDKSENRKKSLEIWENCRLKMLEVKKYSMIKLEDIKEIKF